MTATVHKPSCLRDMSVFPILSLEAPSLAANQRLASAGQHWSYDHPGLRLAASARVLIERMQ
jgi:hypothetical protein